MIITDNLPRAPGVYIFKDIAGIPIYVGMATNLQNRVRSYGRERLLNGSEDKKVQIIQTHAKSIDYILADTVLGAKIMEDYLIFHLRPPLNGVMLPINYNYLKITYEEKFPRLFHTKEISNDGGIYFGPFHSYSRSRDIVFDLMRIFKIRTCEDADPGQRKSNYNHTCLNYEAGLCLGPCGKNPADIGKIRKEYLSNVDSLARVLEGDLKPLNDAFVAKMRKASDELDFETAALYKKKYERILHALRRKKMKLIGPADIQKILERVEHYISEKARPQQFKSGYSRG